MARGPFQGTFQPNARPTVATAPDAVVHINGEAEIAGCPQCTRTFDLNKYITSIQTDLGVDSVPGSANISLSVPRHAIDDFYFDGNPVITTMMEVEIYCKGNFLVEGLPQYYPIFWGLVTEVQDNYSGGEHTVSIHCSDILKWWELCKTNVNPAAIAPTGDQGRNFVGNVFASKNAYDIIFTLATQSFGDVLVGTGSVQNFIRDNAAQDRALTDMTLYWEKRFSKMRSNLVLYGTTGVAVRGDTLFQGYSKNPSENQYIASTTIMNANGVDGGQMNFDPASVAPFKTDHGAGPGGLVQAEYQTKLELAVAAKESIGYEFFMDVTGDIVFKPPFYNLDVLSNKPVSWIQDIDVIDWDFSESESEVVTQLVLQGEFNSTIALHVDETVLPRTTVTDYHLLRKYGWRTQNYNSEFMTDPVELFYHGLDVLDRINAKRHRGNVSIPVRPELRLGFPIYLAPKDEIWYVSGISHSIQFGGRASTTLQLTSRRSKFIAPRGVGTLKLKSFGGESISENKDGQPLTTRYTSRQLSKSAVFELDRANALELPGNEAAFATAGVSNPATPLILRHPKTGRVVGYPNVTMVYSRPFSKSDVNRVVGQQTNEDAVARLPKQAQEVAAQNRAVYDEKQQAQLTAGRDTEIKGKYVHNTYQYGMNAAGVFIYAHDASAVITEALTLPTANVTPVIDQGLKQEEPTTFIRPVSDERGFEVIGHYQYGRRVSLRDGRLIINRPQDKAKIDLQLALSGDLNSILMAQSQGLTTITTGYADPAAELAQMTAEDEQTASPFPGAANSPSRRTPVFSKVGDEYIDDAPLGSQEQRGVTRTVEATQLSRALSLAEMAILDGTTLPDEDCVCITGRAELAFMSNGYKVETLSPSSVDLNELGDRLSAGTLAAAQVKALESRAEALKAYSDVLADESRRQLERSSDTSDPVYQGLDVEQKAAQKLMQSTHTDLSQARKAYAEDTGGPVQVVSTAALEERVRSLTLAIEAAKANAAEVEQEAIKAEPASAFDAKVKTWAEGIAAADVRIKELEAEALRAKPEDQQALEGELQDVTASKRTLQQQIEGARKSKPPEMLQSDLISATKSITQLERQLEDAKLDLTEQQSHYTSSGSIFVQTNAQIVSRVEAFLSKLYLTLDDAHQQFEGAIRGDFTGETNVAFKDLHQEGQRVATRMPGTKDGPDVAPVSEFAPPFSAPERYRLGDPNAAVGALDTGRQDMAKAWSDFSKNLQRDTQNRVLSTQLSQDKASIARLTASRDQLIRQRDSSTVVVGDVQKQIDSMTTQIAKLEQKVADNQAKLSGVK